MHARIQARCHRLNRTHLTTKQNKSSLGLQMAKATTKRASTKAAVVPMRKQVPVRFTEEEYAWVIAAAKADGRPAANFMRHRILQGKES